MKNFFEQLLLLHFYAIAFENVSYKCANTQLPSVIIFGQDYWYIDLSFNQGN